MARGKFFFWLATPKKDSIVFVPTSMTDKGQWEVKNPTGSYTDPHSESYWKIAEGENPKVEIGVSAALLSELQGQLKRFEKCGSYHFSALSQLELHIYSDELTE